VIPLILRPFEIDSAGTKMLSELSEAEQSLVRPKLEYCVTGMAAISKKGY